MNSSGIGIARSGNYISSLECLCVKILIVKKTYNELRQSALSLEIQAGKDDGTAEDIAKDLPGPGARQSHGFGSERRFPRHPVDTVIDHDLSIEWCCENRHGLTVSMPPGATA